MPSRRHLEFISLLLGLLVALFAPSTGRKRRGTPLAFTNALFGRRRRTPPFCKLALSVLGIVSEFATNNTQAKSFRRSCRHQDYWLSLSPTELETATGFLFEQLGYKTKVSGGSGDGGVDVELLRDGRRIIVQCKQYSTAIGPNYVRDLYGTLLHEAADKALLVSPSGFTDGAREFAKGKPILLLGIKHLVKLSKKIVLFQPKNSNAE